MRQRRYLIVVLLTFTGILCADTQVSLKEKSRLRDLVISEHSKIQNIHVKFSVEFLSDPQGVMVADYEWGMSGEKRYRKSTYPYAKNAESSRWGLAVWDGKVFKNYDSFFDNGGVRTNYDPADQENPPTYSPYSRQFGTYSKGTILELFATLDIEDWDCEILDGGERFAFSTNDVGRRDSGKTHKWVFDINKNCMISAYHSTLKIGDEVKPLCDMNVSESKEVKPGIWLPMKSHVGYNIYRSPTSPERTEKNIVVQEISVNENAIEEIFIFEFPSGSQYYDYNLECTVIPNASMENVQGGLDELADDIIRSKRNNTNAGEIEVADSTTMKNEASITTENEKSNQVKQSTLQETESSIMSYTIIVILLSFVVIVTLTVFNKMKTRS